MVSKSMQQKMSEASWINFEDNIIFYCTHLGTFISGIKPHNIII